MMDDGSAEQVWLGRRTMYVWRASTRTALNREKQNGRNGCMSTHRHTSPVAKILVRPGGECNGCCCFGLCCIERNKRAGGKKH